jgi:hypothetical protein
MTSRDEAFAQLNEWKSKAAKLFLYWAMFGVSGWCVGTLQHVKSEVHFGIDGIDGKNFLFVINLHEIYGARYKLGGNPESWPFFAPQRELHQFGNVLEILLLGNEPGQVAGKVVLAEVFPKAAIPI